MATLDDERHGVTDSEDDLEGSSGCSVIGGEMQGDTIVAVLRSLLVGAQTCRLAVGYLFVEGLWPLLASLERLERVDLLIGNVVNRLTEEQMREMGNATEPGSEYRSAVSDFDFARQYRADRDQAARETALNLRRTLESLPRTDANRDTIIALARWIADGRMQVRVTTRSRLYAKVTLVGYPADAAQAPGRAIVGSSNLTLARRGAANSQAPDESNLDVLLEGAGNYLALTRWFERHWSDAQEFHRDLFQELGQSWPLKEQG